jgi:hypothetical protein
MKGNFEIIPEEGIKAMFPENHVYIFDDAINNVSNGFFFDLNQEDNNYVL